MSINFATLQGVTIPEGVVTQIADASGRILWSAAGAPVVLQVEKIVSNTYAAETTYENEEFILLDIYPKKNGTVKVTYGGLTKTITDTSGAESPNSQQVFFGTFNGVSDSVATPASGELTIEGGYVEFGTGTYNQSSKDIAGRYCGCVTGVVDWGIIKNVPDNAFSGSRGLKQITFPKGIKRIGRGAFQNCSALSLTSIPDSVLYIWNDAFYGCSSMTLTELPSGLTSIEAQTFYGCSSLALTSIPESVTSVGWSAFYGCSSMTLTELPSGLTNIGDDAFRNIKSISISTLPSGLTYIGDGAFFIAADESSDSSVDPVEVNFTHPTLPSGLTYIGSYACYNNEVIDFTYLPEGITNIGSCAFMSCDKLTTIVIGDNITTIGKEAFYICKNLTDVTIGKNVTKIDNSAFGWWSGGTDRLTRNYTILATVPPELYSRYSLGFFEVGDNITITVPKGCLDAYKAAESWKYVADYITEAS